MDWVALASAFIKSIRGTDPDAADVGMPEGVAGGWYQPKRNGYEQKIAEFLERVAREATRRGNES